MAKEIWLNLPVKNIAKAKEFYEKIGFKPQENHPCQEDQPDPKMCEFSVGEKEFSLVLIEAETFKGFAQNEIPDPQTHTEILLSIGAGSRVEIDEMASRVFEAGGTIFSAPAETQGWMYGFAFTDLDGHRWNQVFMDGEKMPS